MNIIKTITDIFGNKIYPKTKEMAVYDENNVRLDNKLLGFFTNKGKPSSVANFDNLTDVGTYQIGEANNVSNHPNIGNYLILNVYVGGAYIMQEALSVTTLKRAYRRLQNLNSWSDWSYVVDNTNIIQSDTVGGTDKVASAEVTKALGLEIDGINNNLAYVMHDITGINMNTGLKRSNKIIYSSYTNTISNLGTTVIDLSGIVPSNATVCWIDCGNTFLYIGGQSIPIGYNNGIGNHFSAFLSSARQVTTINNVGVGNLNIVVRYVI